MSVTSSCNVCSLWEHFLTSSLSPSEPLNKHPANTWYPSSSSFTVSSCPIPRSQPETITIIIQRSEMSVQSPFIEWLKADICADPFYRVVKSRYLCSPLFIEWLKADICADPFYWVVKSKVYGSDWLSLVGWLTTAWNLRVFSPDFLPDLISWS